MGPEGLFPDQQQVADWLSDQAGITATEVRVSESQTVTIHLPDIALVETRAHFRQQRGVTSLVVGPKLRGEQIVIVATVE